MYRVRTLTPLGRGIIRYIRSSDPSTKIGVTREWSLDTHKRSDPVKTYNTVIQLPTNLCS
jgi:hypothetical protein